MSSIEYQKNDLFNVAIGVSKAGLKVGLIAKIGDNPFKSLICKKLDDAHIHHENYSDIEKEYTNISSILLNAKGEKTIVNYRTPHQNIMKSAHDYKKIDSAGAIYMANLSMVSLAQRIEVLSYARSIGKKVFANLNVTDCRRPIHEVMSFVEHVDVFIINGYEYADIVKMPYSSIDFHENVIDKFVPFTKDQLLVITDGKKGSYAYHASKVYHQNAVNTSKVLDTTGAGDAYTAGFIAEYLGSKDIEKAMEKGAHYTVSILTKLGAN